MTTGEKARSFLGLLPFLVVLKRHLLDAGLISGNLNLRFDIGIERSIEATFMKARFNRLFLVPALFWHYIRKISRPVASAFVLEEDTDSVLSNLTKITLVDSGKISCKN